LLAGEKTVFLSHLYIKMMILPRQARDKHRENSKKARLLAEVQDLSCWSPMMNLMRHPLWGRGHEGYGEDPFLAGTTMAPFVAGFHSTSY